MTSAASKASSALGSFFGVAASGRSYLTVLYSLVAFPLGVAYFCFLTIGWSLGLGLLIIWIGLIVLLTVLAGSWLFSAFERQQAIHLLGATVEPMTPAERDPERTPWQRFVGFLANRVTWTGMLFLLLKFPLGIASFVAAVTGLSLSFSLLLAPLYYRFEAPDLYYWRIDTLPEALLASLVGALLFILTLHLLNAFGWIWKGLARTLLGRSHRPQVLATA
jgi:hypothetical protein